MELGLLADTSLKDVSFVNLSDESRRDVDANPIEIKRDPATRSPGLETNDREDVVSESTATPGTLWPFIQAARCTRTSTRFARKSRRGRFGRKRWSTGRGSKPKDAAAKIACRGINDTADLSIKRVVSSRGRKPVGNVGVSSERAGLSGSNFSLTQLHARSPDHEAESRDRLPRICRTVDGDEVRQDTWETSSEEIARIDYSGPRYSEFYSSSREIEESRDQTDFLEHSEYLANILSIEDDTEDGTTSSCDKDDETDASFEPRSTTIYKSMRSNNRTRGRPSQSRNRRLEKRGDHSGIRKRKGKIGRRGRRGRGRRGRGGSVANNDRNVPRIPYSLQSNLPERDPDSKRNVIVDTRDTTERMRRRCDCDARRHSYDFTCACKGNLKNTATAIMRDIQAHIRSAEIGKDAEDIRDTISEVPADNPDEKQDKSSKQDILMKYEWDCEFDNEDDLSLRSKQLSTNIDPKAASTNVNVHRKPRKKRRFNKISIDYKLVDRTESTYQGVFHKCVDLDSSALTSSLKISIDENRVSEENDVGTIHSSWPRSSLIEGNSNEYDSVLTLSRKIVSNDLARSEECHDDEQTMISTCYKDRQETPDNSPVLRRRRNNNVHDSETFSISVIRRRSDDTKDTKFVNRGDPTKDIITYRNKRRNIVKLPPTDRRFVRDRSDYVKVTRSTVDDKKADLTRRKTNNKDNDSEYDSDKKQEHVVRRMTRSSIKSNKKNCVGKLIWGYCSGWWPALIVDAAHVGMVSEPGKLWVYWIGESQISLLNEKTQIEPFSRKLEHRLTQKSRKNSRSEAVDETIQMLRQRYDCTLTKPYYYWIRRNIGSQELDDLCFYPYLSKIQERLDVLKEQNAKATEKYILSQRNSPELSKKQITEKIKDTKISDRIEEERLPLQDQNPGVIVWAKLAGHSWWPAMIIDYRDCCMKEPGFACQWIMWYGDYTVSQVHHLSFLRFHKGIEKMRDHIENAKSDSYLVGVLQASKDYCSRLGCNTDNWTLANVFKYFSDMNSIHVPYNYLQVSESNKIYDKYSDEIVKKINERKTRPELDVCDERKDNIEASDALRRIALGESTVEKLCLKCLKFPNGVMEEHPFFVGSLCKDCSDIFKPCMFVFGNDDKCFYCTVCATTGIVVICDREDCPRVYCTACLKFLICPGAFNNILLEDPWVCFLCRDESRLPANGLLRPRLNWKEKISGMFRTASNPVSNDSIVSCEGKGRGIRVLSLFDGLSTGLLVLLKLGIVVDVYYASEIDKDALMIGTAHFGNRINHLGDIRNIKKEKIKEIAPIDLLIGGSPCNDLSLVNPARLGLHDSKGTGVLFFEYCRIMKELKHVNKDHHLFWLYENVAAMPSKYRLVMNKHLGREPDVIDSADFSPQHRLRLYWHNFPLNPYLPTFHKQQDVQDILTPHCNRYSLVKKIRTVTTRTNSLRQGKSELKPIIMKGQSDSLWITELEEIFGFPRHYTDVKNLSASNRQRLIGKSWSVQTLTAILRPLCSYFKCNEDETK